MAFTNAHQEFIESCISYLLDFPNDANALKKSVQQLLDVLNKPDLKNDYTILRHCLIAPEKYFSRLDKITSTKDKIDYITVGEVQQYVINLITQKIEEAGKKCDVTLLDLKWNKENICKKLIAQDNYETQFISECLRIQDDDGLTDWPLPKLYGKIYRHEIISKTINTLDINEQMPVIIENIDIEDNQTINEIDETNKSDSEKEIDYPDEEDQQSNNDPDENEGFFSDDEENQHNDSNEEPDTSDDETHRQDFHPNSPDSFTSNYRHHTNVTSHDLMLGYQIYLKVTVKLNQNKVITKEEYLDEQSFFNSDTEQSAFKEKITASAIDKAEEIAAKAAIDYLATQQTIAPSILMTALGSKGFYKIVTCQYYYERFILGGLAVKDYINYTLEEAVNLTEPFLIDLIQKKLCLEKDIAALKPHEQKIAIHPTYSKLLQSGKIKMTNIIGLKPKREHLLAKQTFAIAVEKSIIPIAEAVNTKLYFAKLFKSSLYQEHLLKNNVWQDAKQIQKEHYRHTLIPVIASLIKHGIIHFFDVKRISNAALRCVKRHPEFEPALLNKQFNLLQLDQANIHNAYCYIFTERLLNIVNGKPLILNKKIFIEKEELEKIKNATNKLGNDVLKYIYYNKKGRAYKIEKLPDTPKLVFNALCASKKYCNMPTEQLQESVIQAFISRLKNKLESSLNTPNSSLKIFQMQLLNLIKESEASLSSNNVFIAIYTSAQHVLKNTKSNFPNQKRYVVTSSDDTLFANKRRCLNTEPPEEILFFERLASLKELMGTAPQHIEFKKM